ncbi:MAG: subclass B3 metallo-beta-lactamase [Gammaproteobacteria bacterium]|jgi:metallo-beta-lactamase class B|nr:subclass B3 metallo-beta-lactamase [Gammaproteobacteria bacterium]
MNRTIKSSVLIFCMALCSNVLSAQNESWTRSYPAVHVIGSLYSVGTYDLSVFLITSDEGHILINTGLEGSTEQIRENIEALGFALEDVHILLTQQAHWDHVAAMAEIKAITGAEMWATKDDARVLEDGGFSDAHFGGEETFEPLAVEKIIVQDDVIELGDIRLTVHDHPGHTEGSSSYSMVVEENGREYDVLIANMGSVNPGKQLAVDPTYPGVAADFAHTFTDQKTFAVDVWVAAHAIQYGLHDKWQPGQAYDPDTFVDPAGYLEAVESHENLFLQAMAAERIE